MNNQDSTDSNPPENLDAVSILDYGNLELESFNKIEEDLALYEKISLLFLLYDPCEESINLSKSILSDDSHQFLRRWAENYVNAHWKETFVEALLIIKNHQILKELNINVEHAKSHFMPHVVEISLFIHPIRKILYAMCEDFDKATTHKFIQSILDSTDASKALNIESADYDYLELFLLKLISSDVVQIGSWMPLQYKLENFVQCDAKPVTSFLQKKFIDMHLKFLNVQQYINRQILMKKQLFTVKSTEKLTNVVNNKLDFDDSYGIKNPKYVGDFIIISNKHFKKSELNLSERRGTEHDVKELTTCWESYGFKIHIYEDLSHSDIPSIIRTHVNMVSQDHGAFAACILSHGTRGKIFGSDSVPIKVNEIKGILCQCEALIGKPKLLIIQACRGDDIMNAVRTSSSDFTDNDVETESDGFLINPPSNQIIPEMADLLIFWATVENFASLRDINKGTWFIQELCVWMTKHGDKQHLQDVFTIVTSELSKKGHQVSQIESTLRKKLWLWKVTNEN